MLEFYFFNKNEILFWFNLNITNVDWSAVKYYLTFLDTHTDLDTKVCQTSMPTTNVHGPRNHCRAVFSSYFSGAYTYHRHTNLRFDPFFSPVHECELRGVCGSLTPLACYRVVPVSAWQRYRGSIAGWRECMSQCPYCSLTQPFTWCPCMRCVLAQPQQRSWSRLGGLVRG